MKWFSLCFLAMLPSSLAFAQDDKLDFKSSRQKFLEVVSPIITEGELEIYKKLPDQDARRYFEAIFWYKRDPEPNTTSNAFRKLFYERRQNANLQFSKDGIVGVTTDRGLVMLFLGDPDNVEQNRLPAASVRPGYEEIWTYRDEQLTFRFVYDGVRPGYRLEDRERWEAWFKKKRNELVLDRGEPYALLEQPLTLPNLGFTKDIENLASEDRLELDLELSFAFFPGDANRTRIMAVVTFRDASSRGMELGLAAYDPYGEKAREIKKALVAENGVAEFFYMAIEPDQYTMVLRVNDKDGREAIYRRQIDVPPLRGKQPQASSLLLADNLKEVPLYGFLHPKEFVYSDTYFPIRNEFTGFTGDRIYVNQFFYNFPDRPQPRWFIDNREVAAKVEHLDRDGSFRRMVVSLPCADLAAGRHLVKSVYANEEGSLSVHSARMEIGQDTMNYGNLVERAREEKVRLVHPSGDTSVNLDRVVARADADVTVRRMYVYLNGALLYEQDKAPWEVSLSNANISISSRNTISAVLDTDRGLLRATRTYEPVKIGERYGTRLVQVFFNAFDEALNFVQDLDVNKLKFEVNGETHEVKDIKKLEEPITYCFLVDTSYSMKDSFNGNVAALKKFIQSMRPEDKGYFVTFSDKYSQILRPNPSKAVLLAVADSLTLQKPNPKHADRLYEENQTYLYDATIAAIHTLVQYPGRTVILVISDGVAVEGIYARNGMLSYARENEAVIYSLWMDNNPKLSEDELQFLQKEMGGGERFARKIGLARFFSKKDARKTVIGNKVRDESINQGLLKIMSEESGGFHYRIFRDDRNQIREYVEDIQKAVGSQYVATLTLPVARTDYEVNIESTDETLDIRNKSKVKVSKTNPLLD